MNATNQSDRKPLQAINEELSAEDENEEDDWDDGFRETRKAPPANDLEDLVELRPRPGEEAYYDKTPKSRKSKKAEKRSEVSSKRAKPSRRARDREHEPQDIDEDEDEPPEDKPIDSALDSYLSKWSE